MAQKKIGSDYPLASRLAMVEPDNPELSIITQCALLQINRSTYYYQEHKKPQVSEEDLLIMHEIDKIYTEFPVYGVRRMSEKPISKLYLA